MSRKEGGFTLLEGLTVMAIISTLAAVAITQLGSQRARAFDARANSMLRDTITAEEGYFVDQDTYAPSLSDLTSVTPSPGVVVEISGANDSGWRARAFHPAGSKTFCFDGHSNAVVVELGGVGTICP